MDGEQRNVEGDGNNNQTKKPGKKVLEPQALQIKVSLAWPPAYNHEIGLQE